jgi:hypothetical protein
MSSSEHRQIARDSLFVLARLRLAGQSEERRVRVRNLSSGGLMAEGDFRVVSGEPVSIEIRNLGWVDGTVAWVQANRFGIAFAEEIDPQAVRGSSASNETAELMIQRSMPVRFMPNPDPRQLRKI